MNDETLKALEVEAERTKIRRAEGVYGTASAEWWPVIEPDEVSWLVAEVRRLREFPRGACPECRMLVSIEQERDHFDGIPTGVASRIVVRRGYDLEYEITGTITRRVLR